MILWSGAMKCLSFYTYTALARGRIRVCVTVLYCIAVFCRKHQKVTKKGRREASHLSIAAVRASAGAPPTNSSPKLYFSARGYSGRDQRK